MYLTYYYGVALGINPLLDALLTIPPFFVISLLVHRAVLARVVEHSFETIDRIRKSRRLTILLVEQRVVEALELCDRGYVLETGRVALEGSHATLLADPRVRRAYLGA